MCVVLCCEKVCFFRSREIQSRKKTKTIFFNQTFAFFGILCKFLDIIHIWLWFVVVVFAIGPAIDGLVFFLVDFATRE